MGDEIEEMKNKQCRLVEKSTFIKSNIEVIHNEKLKKFEWNITDVQMKLSFISTTTNSDSPELNE